MSAQTLNGEEVEELDLTMATSMNLFPLRKTILSSSSSISLSNDIPDQTISTSQNSISSPQDDVSHNHLQVYVKVI